MEATNDISMDEYKAMHALCCKFYYKNIPEEKKETMRERQRNRNRERYRTDPEYKEKIRLYMRGYNERKKAARMAAAALEKN